jgi:hypothetical protein
LTLKSPAKINLFLQVLKKRDDGYHEIRTLMQAVDLCDELTLEKTASGIRLSRLLPFCYGRRRSREASESIFERESPFPPGWEGEARMPQPRSRG